MLWYGIIYLNNFVEDLFYKHFIKVIIIYNIVSLVTHYKYKKTKERQKSLSELYYFSCKCEACTLPELKYFVETNSAKKCSKCNGALCQTKRNLFCISCGDKPQHYQKTEVKQAKQLYKEAKNKLELGELLTAAIKVNQCLDIRETVLYKYNQGIINALHLKGEIYFRMDEIVQTIAFTDEIIIDLKERFGYSSLEVLSTLKTVTKYCLEYLLKKSNTTAIYRYVLERTEEYLNEKEEITNFIYGSWSKFYEDVKKNQEMLILMRLRLVTCNYNI